MNNYLLVTIILVMSYSISTKSYTEGIEFIQIQKTVQNAPQVVEFFSFYCSYCYEFESIYHISQLVAQNLPKNIKIERNHVDFGGALATELTKAWAVAMVLKVEDKVLPLLFEGIQKLQSIKTPTDIKAVFIKVGIKHEEYDAVLNSFIVKALVIKQQQRAKDFQLRGVPAIYVNGEYMVYNKNINIKDPNNYAKAYSDIIKFLINK